MEEFKVILTEVAQKDLDTIDHSLRLRILEKIKELSSNPFPRGDTVKRLKGVKLPLYRLRAGDYRIVYHIDGRNVAVMFVTDRKDLERRLRRFF